MATLRRVVADLGEDGVVFRSRPERLARDLLRATGLPQPRVNAWFATRVGHGHELDLWWPSIRLDVEIDGPHHRMPRQRRMDRLRDADLASFGVTVLRIDADVVRERPVSFVTSVREAFERG